MSSANRPLTFSLAINEALHQAMEADPRVFVLGQGVKSPWYVGNTVRGLLDRFGDKRVIDTPVSESAMTGLAVGASVAGMRGIVVHPRMDFMLYGFDAIVNEAANWRYMSGGVGSAPVVFWGIINRGGEQAAQHSQALHGMLAHAPGLKVVMPASPADAKGLMVAAIRDPDPVLFVDDRWLYSLEGHVPEELYETPIGKARVAREGSDLTLAALSCLVPEATKAAVDLESEGVAVEVLDLRSLKPLDVPALLASVEKTRHLIVADPGWRSFGASGEIIAAVAEQPGLAKRISRVTLPDAPAPASRTLEHAYYPRYTTILAAARAMLA